MADAGTSWRSHTCINHNPSSSSLDCTYHFDMFTNRLTWGQWYMRSNDWVTSCFKWPSLKIHWPNMTLAVYQYFLLVSQVQISPLQNQCVYCYVWNALYPLNYPEAHEPQADPRGLNSCFNTDRWWTNICENKIQNKQTKKTPQTHDKSHDILPYTPQHGYWHFTWICLSTENTTIKIIASAS